MMTYGIMPFQQPGDPRDLVEDFVTRFYRLCLDREPDPAGLSGWTTGLMDGVQTGSDVAYGFVFSTEFLSKNTDDEEFLTILYEAFFNRQPDEAGRQAWLEAMQNGASRDDVLKGFIFAPEFAALCDAYTILPFDALDIDDDGDGYYRIQGRLQRQRIQRSIPAPTKFAATASIRIAMAVICNVLHVLMLRATGMPRKRYRSPAAWAEIASLTRSPDLIRYTSNKINATSLIMSMYRALAPLPEPARLRAIKSNSPAYLWFFSLSAAFRKISST